MKPSIIQIITGRIPSRILFVVVTCAAIALSRADDLPGLNKECFQQKKGRSCVKLGTSLWQIPARRNEARAAFAAGCDLKIESACTLKDMPASTSEEGDVGIGTAVPEAKSKHAIKGIERSGPSKFKISRTTAVEYAGDLDNTLSTAEMEANVVKGVRQGYRFKSISKTSIFSALGFLPNDVITRVNDQEIKSSADAMSLLPSLLTGQIELYAVHMIRDGRSITQQYQIAD